MTQITTNHIDAALQTAVMHNDGKYSIVDVFNKAQELAEQATQDQFLTADEARALGTGNAEWSDKHSNGWRKIESEHFAYVDTNWFDSAPIQYRAIRKEVPAEPTCQVRNDDTGVTETMTRGAAQKLQAETKDVCDWSWCNSIIGTSYIDGLFGHSGGIYTYRCKAKPTCQVRNDDTGELKAMTRESAQKLQAETNDACNWYSPHHTKPFDVDGFISEFIQEGIYTYRSKAKKQVILDPTIREGVIALLNELGFKC